MSETKHGDNGSESLFSTQQLGERSADAIADVYRGRITKGQARKIREACREILKKADSEITDADKEILSQYVGAGGTNEENTSNSGILYEFYTPRNVVSKMWELIDKYNPRKDKTVIEPSCGIGRFAEGRQEKFTMFELEEESARIAQLLHPDAEIVQGAFQEHFLKNKQSRFTQDFEKYDVAIGNPPYGAYTGKYKGMGEGKEFKRYESYFMSRSLDTLKDGGIMAMVVPSTFMDGTASYGKDLEKIVAQAELLEAWRLPNGTFESTDVGTDIVIFKKGKGTEVERLTTYFEKNPDHIAGIVSTRTGRFGEETYVKPKDGQNFESAVASIDVNKVAHKARVETIKKRVRKLLALSKSSNEYEAQIQKSTEPQKAEESTIETKPRNAAVTVTKEEITKLEKDSADLKKWHSLTADDLEHLAKQYRERGYKNGLDAMEKRKGKDDKPRPDRDRGRE